MNQLMPSATALVFASGAFALISNVPNALDSFGFPSGLTLDARGDIVLADRQVHRVFRIDARTGATTTIAGTGEAGFSGDGGPATAAALKNPEWVEFDRAGNLIVSDRGNHRLRRIDARSGTISTIVGTGAFEAAGDGGPALDAGLTNPFGFTQDRDGNLFIFDTEAHCVRRVDAKTLTIATVIGSRQQGFSGDGGPATTAMLYRPHNGVFDSTGRLVFGDSFNQRIRRWDPETGVITTIAGNGERGSATDGTAAAQAPFTFFGAMVYTQNGDLVFTSLDHRILKLEAKSDVIRVVAGTGEPGFSGDGGPATKAQLNTPYGLALTASGDLIVADASNKRVRRIDGRTGVITTIAPVQ
jgi:NHL repeat-containing protein